MKKLIALLMALVMVLSLAACGSSSSSDSSAAADTSSDAAATEEAAPADDAAATDEAAPAETSGEAPASLTVGTGNVLGTFLPFSTNETCHWGCMLVYDYLFYWDENNEVYSDILSDWGYLEDGTTFYMTIKDGVTFANGDVATGEDLLFSLQNLLDRGTTASTFYTTVDLANCSVDGNTAYIANSSEFGPGIINMGTIYLLDKSWAEEVGYDDIDAWTLTPNGSGPYEVTEYVTDDHVTMQLRDGYWGDFTGGAQTITIKHYADTSAEYMALEGGEIDMALNIAESDYSRALENSDISVEITHEGDVILLGLDSTYNEYLADENVRLAIAYGVNWEEVATAARGALTEVATSTLPSNSPFYVNVGSYEYDPDLAAEYLAKSAYPDGFTLSMTTVDQPVKTNAGTVIQYYLGQMGITLETNYVDFPTALGVWNTAGGTDMNFQDTDIGSICGEPYLIYSKFEDTGEGTRTMFYINDEEFNTLLKEASYTTDQATRESAYAELQQYVHDTALIIPIYESIDAVAYNPNVIASIGNMHSAVGANLRFVVYA